MLAMLLLLGPKNVTRFSVCTDNGKLQKLKLKISMPGKFWKRGRTTPWKTRCCSPGSLPWKVYVA